MPRLMARILIVLLIAIAGGCAAACHDCSCGGCVPYTYCPPPPLPYRTYCGCATPVAAYYSTSQQVVTFDASTLQPPSADETVPSLTSP
jgi:hypothetical protein